MGAWSEKNFGNDSALDWVSDFAMNPSNETLMHTFQEAIKSNDYIEVDLASYVLAAAEVVAGLNGKKSTDFPNMLNDCLTHLELNNELKAIAKKAILKVTGDSELKQLWEEDGEHNPEWRFVIDDLLKRLE